MTFLLKTHVSLVWNERKKKKAKDRQRSKKLKKLLCLFSFCEKKGQRDDEKEKQKKLFKKESAPLEKKHILSLRGNERTKREQRKSSFQPKRQKKNHRYLAIKLTHVDTFYSLKHSHTHNVLCYPIRCCAIRSLERRFQEKRQSSVSRGGVVLVLLMFFVRIVLFYTRARGEREIPMDDVFHVGWWRWWWEMRLTFARAFSRAFLKSERKKERAIESNAVSFIRSFFNSFFTRSRVRSRRRTRVRSREFVLLSTPFVYTSCVLCLTRRQIWLIFWFFFSLFGREFLDASNKTLTISFAFLLRTALATTSPRRWETIPKRSRTPWLANPTGTPTKVATRSRSPRKRRRPRTPRKTRKPRRDAPPPPPRWRLSAKPPAPNQRKVSFPAFKILLFFDSLKSRTEEVYSLRDRKTRSETKYIRHLRARLSGTPSFVVYL